MEMEDRLGTLIAKAQAGDRRAFEDLIQSYGDRISSLILSRLGKDLRRGGEAQDVIQETLLRAFRSIDRFRPQGPDSFLRWLGGIAEHVVLNLVRKRAREERSPLGEEVEATTLSATKALRRGERFDRLEEALRTLSADHRQVILLARIEGLPMKEVARRMDRSSGAATQLLLRALKSLRAAFGDTGSFHLPPRTLGNGGNGGPHGQL